MPRSLNRRRFLQVATASFLGIQSSSAIAAQQVPDFSLTVISGKPRERGRQYRSRFKDSIQAFLDREIYSAFTGKPSTRDAMLGYAGQCSKSIRQYVPLIHDELEGMAEGSGLKLEELVLITLHEELWHRGVLPKVEHCTAVAIGPPDTRDGNTYVGQTWDWMTTVAGLSTMLLWKREEGPSLLAYAFPGLWCGAGVNAAGLALCWTSAGGKEIPGPRVGIPSYVLLTHLLYQDSLEAVIAEARRVPQAGWFTFVMADGEGQLLNLEGSPKELAVENHRGRLARVGYGSRQMTRTAEPTPIKYHARCRKMYDMLEAGQGKQNGTSLQHHFGDASAGISVGKGTIDMMVYNTTKREAHLSRGPEYGAKWMTYRF